jgi:FHA domain
MMSDCPYCGYTKNVESAKRCSRCGLPLKRVNQATTRALQQTEEDQGTPRWGTAGFNSRMNLILKVRDFDKAYTFDAAEITELTLGRVNPDTGEAPTIDLLECKGIEKGVSRRHASIVRRDGGTLSIIDQGSDNGTFLNGQRLIARQPRILRDGDEVRLGELVIYVRFEKERPR